MHPGENLHHKWKKNTSCCQAQMRTLALYFLSLDKKLKRNTTFPLPSKQILHSLMQLFEDLKDRINVFEHTQRERTEEEEGYEH